MCVSVSKASVVCVCVYAGKASVVCVWGWGGVGVVESKTGKRDVCEGGKMCWGRGPWSVGHKHARAHTQ